MTIHQDADERVRISPLVATTRCAAHRGWRDAMLLLRALRLLRAAQAIRAESLATVIERMRRAPRPGAGRDLAQIVCATLRAARIGRRWFGWLDSCLTRSLVAATLARGHDEVVLHVGFSEQQPGAAVNGHAWVTVGATLLLEDRDPQRPDARYRSTLTLPMD